MSTRTLMLTPWMAPYRVISWERAIVLSYLGKVEVLEEYDESIHGVSISLRTPAVVRLTKARVPIQNKVRFSRTNVFLRDGFRCQYCGEKRPASELNYDHVLPRFRGGKTAWENIVTSCYACNDRKGSRTPAEAGMTLLRQQAEDLAPSSSDSSWLDRSRDVAGLLRAWWMNHPFAERGPSPAVRPSWTRSALRRAYESGSRR